MEEINAQNYMKCSKTVLRKCLKVCGVAIQIPRLNDERVKNREKILLIKSKNCYVWTILCKILPQKAIHYAQIVLPCE